MELNDTQIKYNKSQSTVQRSDTLKRGKIFVVEKTCKETEFINK